MIITLNNNDELKRFITDIYNEFRIKGGHLRPTRMDVTHVRCSHFGELNLTGEFKEPETYLDPNF